MDADQGLLRRIGCSTTASDAPDPRPPPAPRSDSSLGEQTTTAVLPPRFPAELAYDVLASDGVPLHVRPIRPDDASRLVEFHDQLSPETIYLRFFTAHPHLSSREVERFTQVDYRDRLALVAERDGQLLGVARYDRVPGTDDAEVAFVVRDAEHGHGLATLLLEHLAAAASDQGIRRFFADTLASNSPMQSVFRNAGFKSEQHFDDGVVKVTFPIEVSTGFLEKVERRAHISERRSIETLLRPRAVAVVSDGPSAASLVRTIRGGGFTGEVYTVASLNSSPPAAVDLVIIDLPAEQVLDVAAPAAGWGARNLIVLSGGFADAGADGAERQRRLVDAARKDGMRVLGPHSLGVANTDPDVSLNTTPGPAPARGKVALLSQSGAIGMLGLAEAIRSGAGVSSFVSLGDHADVSTDALLEYWEDDEATGVICLHIESIANPRRFARLTRRISRTKPIVVLKSGHAGVRRLSTGGNAASSASAEEAVDALLAGAGVIRVRTLTELFDTAFVLAHQPLPTGRRVAIVSTSKGAGLIAADACAELGLAVANLSPTTSVRLCGLLLTPPAGTSLVAASAEHLEVILDAVLADPGVDAAIAISAPPNDRDRQMSAGAIASAAGRSTKPVLGCGLRPDTQPPILPAVGNRRVPWFPYPEQAAVALAHAAAYQSWRARPAEASVALDGIDPARAATIVTKVLAAAPHGRRLESAEIAELLSAYGVKMARREDLEPGGRAELALAVSVTNDPLFGPMLSAGLGGDTGQLVGGRAHCSVPMARSSAAQVARAIPGVGLIVGSLQQPSADPRALEDAILRIARLAEDVPELAELALHPLIAPSSGVVVQAAYGRIRPRTGPEPWLRHLP